MSKLATAPLDEAPLTEGGSVSGRSRSPDAAGHAKVFISYSRKDMAFADRLEAALRARGFEPLIDRSEIYAFEDWWKRIEALIGRADTIVFVLSPDAVASEVALKEVSHAASLNKRFAPIVCRRVEDSATPEPLRRLNFIFFDDPTDFEVSADQLAEALQTDIGWIRKHTEYGEGARHWSAAGRPGGLLLRSPTLEEAERWIASRPRGAPAPTEETQAFVAESRRGASRRRNILTGSLAAGLLVALALAGLAYWQRGIAVEQRVLADRQRQRAEDANLYARLTSYRDSLAIMDRLAKSDPGNAGLQRGRSVFYERYGDVQMAQGDLAGALTSYRDSLAIRDRLAKSDPGNADWQRDLAVSLIKVGDVLVAQGDLAGALTSYRDSLAIMDRLAKSDPGNGRWQRDLSVALNKVGDVQMAQGDLAGALTSYRDSLAIRDRLAKSDPGNADWQRDLAVSWNKVGDVQMAQGDLAGALTSYRDSLAIIDRLVKSDPGNDEWQRDLSVSYAKLADVYRRMNDRDNALAALWQGQAIMDRLTKLSPGDAGWKRDLAWFNDQIAALTR